MSSINQYNKKEQTMNTPVTGIHHVTAVASDPQANVDFYAGLLGLRLVKKTVNFDDPSAYHLYYGDESGSPGTALTFFYWPGLGARGRVGAGQSTTIVFSAPPGSLDYWEARLRLNGVKARGVRRFGEDTLRFADPDRIPVEIVAADGDARRGWTGGDVPAEYALRGFHTAELTLRDGAPTARLLTETMGFRKVREEGARIRFAASGDAPGAYADLVTEPAAAGTGGAGTIHHVAWSVPDDEAELRMREDIRRAGYDVSPVRDRNYFHSIYYPEPGGILFEIATAGPGFTIDETLAELGTGLMLPGPFEKARAAIEQALPPIDPPKAFKAPTADAVKTADRTPS